MITQTTRRGFLGGTGAACLAVIPRFLPVKGDSMEPTLNHGDGVAVVPTDRWLGDGLYVLESYFGTPDIVRCRVESGLIVVGRDNPRYSEFTFTAAQFEAAVIGRVVALCHVVDPGLFAPAG